MMCANPVLTEAFITMPRRDVWLGIHVANLIAIDYRALLAELASIGVADGVLASSGWTGQKGDLGQGVGLQLGADEWFREQEGEDTNAIMDFTSSCHAIDFINGEGVNGHHLGRFMFGVTQSDASC